MAAPTIAALLDFETNLEDALRAYLLTAYPAYQVLTPRTTISVSAKKLTPRVEVQLVVTGTGLAEHDRTTDGKTYRSQKGGTFTIRVVARRNDATQSLGTMRGAIRKSMLEATLALDDTALPYYQVISVEESSSKPAIQGENDEIECELEYAITWWIKPDQWPVS